VSGLAPYRTEALAVVRLQVEWAFCPWCKHVNGLAAGWCERPESVERLPWANGERPAIRCRDANPRGYCPDYTPGLVTRALRCIGLRAPVLVDADPPKPPPRRGGKFD
jgi:hypothetical protein